MSITSEIEILKGEESSIIEIPITNVLAKNAAKISEKLNHATIFKKVRKRFKKIVRVSNYIVKFYLIHFEIIYFYHMMRTKTFI